jgi:hypothetical protein
MATELERQLSAHRTKTLKSASVYEGKASLFLSPKEAAAVDTDAIYEAAANGLQTLIQYDERLEDFLEGILHPSSVDLQRELKTANVLILFLKL